MGDIFDDLVIGSARGRRPQPVAMSFVRDINPSDAHLLANPPPQGSKTSPVIKLRQQHHMVARLVAEGVKGVEISAITGYSQSRISILKNDPAFKELVAYYTDNSKEIYLDMHSRLATLGEASIEEIRERLEDDPESFSNRELMMVAELTLDRSVAPPKAVSKSQGGQVPTLPSLNITFVTPQSPQSPQTPSPAGITIDIKADSADDS